MSFDTFFFSKNFTELLKQTETMQTEQCKINDKQPWDEIPLKLDISFVKSTISPNHPVP